LAGAGDDALQPASSNTCGYQTTSKEPIVAPLHGRIIDAWMQHPMARFRAEPIFDPLRRWFPTANLAAEDEIPLAATLFGPECR
jgi:hypothetical protein